MPNLWLQREHQRELRSRVVLSMTEITSLDELKRLELEIMQHIHVFCENAGIKYCLTFGTLLGAVRHKGFIPWDDDIDIYMFRDDYEKFRKQFPEYGQKHNLYIAASDTKPCFPRAFMKVCDGRTKLVEPKYKYSEDIGVFVDIWPLDGAPRNALLRKIHFKKMLLAHRLFYAGIEKDDYYTGTGVAKQISRVLSNIVGQMRIERYIERIAKKYPVEEDGYVECYAAKIRNFKYSDIVPFHLASFETTQFYIPDNYDKLLKKIYGDYMQLPPENERVPHHVIDTYWLE